MKGKTLYWLTLGLLITFVAVQLFNGMIRDVDTLIGFEEAFRWITLYLLPWVSLILLVIILIKLNRK